MFFMQERLKISTTSRLALAEHPFDVRLDETRGVESKAFLFPPATLETVVNCLAFCKIQLQSPKRCKPS